MSNENYNDVQVYQSGREPISETIDKPAIQPQMQKKTILIISITAGVVVIAVLAITLPLTLKKDDKTPENKITQYGCLIDSGSSSSKGYIYKWFKSNNDSSIPELTQIKKSDKVKPALGSTKNDSEIEQHVNTLLEFCEDGIIDNSNNSTNISESPFYLKATAGMRKLSEDVRNNKISVVRKVLKNSNFMFINDDWARVISGEDEGIYGWITVNYLNNIFKINNEAKTIKQQSFGVIDLGGSSVEITFIPEIKLNSDGLENIPLGLLSYDIFVKVFEYYGQGDAFNKILDLLIHDNNQSTDINHPCLNSGYTYRYTLSGTEYTFTGIGDSDECQTLTKRILNLDNNCNGDDNHFCGIDGKTHPKISKDMKFYGLNALTYSANFYGIDNKNYHSAKSLLEGAKTFCAKSWDDAKNENPNLEESYLNVYCFSGTYYYNLLVYGFGFDKNWENIIFSNEIEETEIGFALGAMVFEVDSLNLLNE